MAVFGVECDPSGESSTFFQQVNARLQSYDIMKNPFIGRVKRIHKDFYVVDMSPVFPNITFIGWIVAFICLGLGWIPGLAIGSFLGLCGLFWSRFFLFLMLRLGIRKAGYKGRVVMLPPSKTIRGLM